jgi:hypothetical protein
LLWGARCTVFRYCTGCTLLCLLCVVLRTASQSDDSCMYTTARRLHCVSHHCVSHHETLHKTYYISLHQRLREREKFDRSQAKAVSMVGSKKEKEAEEGSGKISEVWRSMSLEELEPIPEPEPGEQQGSGRRGEEAATFYCFDLI